MRLMRYDVMEGLNNMQELSCVEADKLNESVESVEMVRRISEANTLAEIEDITIDQIIKLLPKLDQATKMFLGKNSLAERMTKPLSGLRVKNSRRKIF